jgi:hypothetical protein
MVTRVAGSTLVANDPDQTFERLDLFDIRAIVVWGYQIGQTYFVIRCLVGCASAVGAAGEIANVSHVLQPGARLAVSKSP